MGWVFQNIRGKISCINLFTGIFNVTEKCALGGNIVLKKHWHDIWVTRGGES